MKTCAIAVVSVPAAPGWASEEAVATTVGGRPDLRVTQSGEVRARSGEPTMKAGRQDGGTVADVPENDNGGLSKLPGGLMEWAAEINRHFAQGASSTLTLARVVASARTSLARGQWTALWSSRRVPFSKRKAEMLVVIGNKLAWLNAQMFARLPHGWSVLYQLAHLPQDTLEQFIENGRVHSALTLREARVLVAEVLGRPARRASGRAGIRSRLLRLSRFVHQTLADWSAADRLHASTQLTHLLEQIAGRSSGQISETLNRCQPNLNVVSPV